MPKHVVAGSQSDGNGDVHDDEEASAHAIEQAIELGMSWLSMASQLQHHSRLPISLK